MAKNSKNGNFKTKMAHLKIGWFEQIFTQFQQKNSNFLTDGPIFKCHTILETSESQKVLQILKLSKY